MLSTIPIKPITWIKTSKNIQKLYSKNRCKSNEKGVYIKIKFKKGKNHKKIKKCLKNDWQYIKNNLIYKAELNFNINRVFPSDKGPLFIGLRPYGQPGPLPIDGLNRLIDWVKSSNFISWLLYNQARN